MLSLMESGGVAFLVSLFVTPLWIRFLTHRSYGQRIHEDAPSTHLVKAGTPTMGGVIIVVAAVIGYAMGHVGTSIVFTRSGFLVLAVIIASGFLGFSTTTSAFATHATSDSTSAASSPVSY